MDAPTADFLDKDEATISSLGQVLCGCDKFWQQTPQQKKTKQPRHCQHTDELRIKGRLHFQQVGEFYFKMDKGKPRGCHKALQKFVDMVNAVEALPPTQRIWALPEVELVKFRIESHLLLGRCPEERDNFMVQNVRLRNLIQECPHG